MLSIIIAAPPRRPASLRRRAIVDDGLAAWRARIAAQTPEALTAPSAIPPLAAFRRRGGPSGSGSPGAPGSILDVTV